jgi:hypothetical protein
MARGKKVFKTNGLTASSQPHASSSDKMEFSVSDPTEPSQINASAKTVDELDRELTVGGSADPQNSGTNASQSGEEHFAKYITKQDAPTREEYIEFGNDRGKRLSGAQRRRRNREKNAVLRENDELRSSTLTPDFIKHVPSTINHRASAQGEDSRSILSESTLVSLGRSVSNTTGENDFEIVSRLQNSTSEEPSDVDVTYVPRAARPDSRLRRQPPVRIDGPRAHVIARGQTDEPVLQESSAAQTEQPKQLDDSWETKDVMLEGQRLSRKLKGVTAEIERHSTARTQAYEQIRAAQDEIARLTRTVAAETAAIERKENESKADRERLHRAYQILGLD